MPEALARVDGFPAAGGPLDLEVCRGEVVLLAGPNGCGKTSLLRALAGLPAPLKPANAQVQGRLPPRVPAHELRSLVRVALQDPRENLVGLTVRGEFRLRGQPLPESLHALAYRDVATLSSGEARRVTLAAAAQQEAPLLLLDEPTEGLDEVGRQRLRALVAEARTRGAVVAADHDGLLADVATRTVRLAASSVPSPAAPLPLGATAGPTPIVLAPAATLQRADRDIGLPALELPSGIHAVVGRNGAGKTTLLLRLAGLLDAQGGTVAGRPPIPGETARMLLPHAGDLFTRATVAEELAGTADLGLVSPSLETRHPLALSAGEAQRVALAKVLGRPSPLYLLDEPEAHLDADGRTCLLRAMAGRAAEGACIVLATHDEALAAWATSRLRLEGP